MHRYRYKKGFHQVAVWCLFVKLKTSTFFSERSQFGLSEGSGTQRRHYCFISQFFGIILRLQPVLMSLPKKMTVCDGTKNFLSTTGNSEIQYNLMKTRYNNCDIVMGNLEIIMTDHTRDFSFLESIKEVTGYILFAINEFSRLPLDHLRIIRGSTLYEDQYALAVMVNYQRDGEHGLQELGLTHLTEILRGGVKIIHNKYLSYAPQVNWLDIVKDGSAQIMIEDNGPEKPCHKACGDVPCWGPGNDTCQILTKTVCALSVVAAALVALDVKIKCSSVINCILQACRNFNNSGSCVPQCPQTVIYNKLTYRMEPNPNAKYQYGSICVTQCPKNFVVDGSSCVSNCPSNKMEVEKNGVKTCEPCKGLCPKVCHGTSWTDSNRETVDARNIESFINCTKIQGSLNFLVTGIEGDPFNDVPPLDPEKLKIFNTVEEITDFLNIQSWPANMSDLSVFSNLQTIRGRKLYNYALLVVKINSLTSLGLRSLQNINDGAVYIKGNKNLCYHDTVNWTRLLGSRPQKRSKLLDVTDNQKKDECVKENHVCHPLCSSDGCWGPGPDQCVSCKKYSRGGTCVPDCMFLTGKQREFATKSGECLPCHPECKVQEGKETCTGPGANKCLACASLKDGPHCVSMCPEGVMGQEGTIFKYPDKEGNCKPCHNNCTQRCTGPGIGDCTISSRYISGQMTTAIVLGVIALIFASFSIFVLSILYRRSLAIRRKRAMRRYMMNSESFEPLEDKGTKYEPRTLKPSELRKIRLLGNGVFGSVHKGVWIPEGDTVKLPVAIKTIDDRSGRRTFSDVTDHMRMMASLNHINVVRTLGICPGNSLQLVTPLNRQGSLLAHVKKNKGKLSPQRLLNWCVQIAKGMNYLEENRMVHRNLAARNVLLNDNFTAQVSDYGIADLLYSDDKKYYCNEPKTPIRWMALESILFRRYTHQSDVWSYGVTIWEMMSYGAEPYSTMRPQEVPDLLEKGERLPQPQICTIDVYMVMVKCWMIDENVRPTFKELASEFTRMARDPPRYLVIKVRQLHHSTAILNPSSGTGYLPMTSGVDNHTQAMWQSRSRLNSARTVSESSEGCGTGMEMEMGEDFPLAGSLKRRRHREDSAYVSQRDSMSGGPPETPSPEMEEEDQNGYVLPGGSPERGDTITVNLQHTNSYCLEMTSSCDTAVSMEVRGSYTRSKDNSDSEQQGSSEVEYEYMDIRGGEKLEGPPVRDPPPPPAPVRMSSKVEEEEDEYVEDSNYHYTNRQPKEENGAAGQTEQHQSVRAGVRVTESAVGDRSFDNPGYWHSRMFLKPSAVPT
uniref:Receptor protein-tyrosine kinase n=1 Tax=Oreochromis niloticus TaxID=8128 RepID=A0A669F8D7_ORENI